MSPPPHPEEEPFPTNYKKQSLLGTGSFATVHAATHTYTKKQVAVKAVPRVKLNRKLAESLEGEIRILKGIVHDKIVGLWEIEKTETHIFLIMEYCSGGDLSAYIKAHRIPHSGLSFKEANHFAQHLASAVYFMNQHQLMHRDLKPQNLLLSPTPNDLPKLKVADFGFARFLPSLSLASTLCGSPLYMAPEILRHSRYDARVDLWSIGAVYHELACGKPPFQARNHIDLLKIIESTTPSWRRIDTEFVPLKELCSRLLERDADKRITFQEFFAHPFFEETAKVQTIPTPSLVKDLPQSYSPIFLRRSVSPPSLDTLRLDDTNASPRQRKMSLQSHYNNERNVSFSNTSWNMSGQTTSDAISSDSFIVVSKRDLNLDFNARVPPLPPSLQIPVEVTSRSFMTSLPAFTPAAVADFDLFPSQEDLQTVQPGISSSRWHEHPLFAAELTKAKILDMYLRRGFALSIIANTSGLTSSQKLEMLILALSVLQKGMELGKKMWTGSDMSPGFQGILQKMKTEFDKCLALADTARTESMRIPRLDNQRSQMLKKLYDTGLQLTRQAATEELRIEFKQTAQVTGSSYQMPSSSPRPSYQSRQRSVSIPHQDISTGSLMRPTMSPEQNQETWIARVQNLYRFAWMYLVFVIECRQSSMRLIGDLDWNRDETLECGFGYDPFSNADEEETAIWGMLKAIRSRFLAVSSVR